MLIKQTVKGIQSKLLLKKRKKKKHKKILDKPDEDLYNKKDKVMKAR